MAHSTPLSSLDSRDYMVIDMETGTVLAPERLVLVPTPSEEDMEAIQDSDSAAEEYAREHGYVLYAPVAPLR